MQLEKEVVLKKYKCKIKKLSEKELRFLCKEISILLESGCEITKILEVLEDKSNKKVKDIFIKITNQIQKGNSITEAFQYTKVFSNFFISMVKVGELSGNLDIIMNNLSIYYEKEYKSKQKIKAIMIYPIILITVAIVSLCFMIFFIAPNFQMIFENNSINPPIMTKILINLFMYIRDNYIKILIISITINIFIFLIFKKSKRVKYIKNKLKFSIPIIKDFNLLIITTKFCRSFSILIESGVNILEAIELSSSVVDDQYIKDKILKAIVYLHKGSSIEESLALVNVFPKLFISMVNVGEESGRLDKSLSTLRDFYENELDTKIDFITRSIEPLITVIIGLSIGLFVISMVLPMFDAINSI